MTEHNFISLKWFSPLNPPFQITGFPWLKEEGKYRRLTLSPKFVLPAKVNELADCTAGGQIRFQTNSTKVSIRVSLRGTGNMYHMPETGQCGFDCYIEKNGQLWYHSSAQFDPGKPQYESVLFEQGERQFQAFVLYFPLYQGVKEVEVGLAPESSITASPAFASNKRVVLYGTSITQGGCASRPGMAYTNILSRRFPMEFINLGFSGSGLGEPEVAKAIRDIPDQACLVLDYEANCPSVEHMERTLPEFIKIYRENHAVVPILVLSKIRYAREIFDEQLLETRLMMKQIQIRIVDEFRKRGDAHIHFYDGSELLGADFHECSVDGTHPTDMGFVRMANELTPVFKNLLYPMDGE